MALSSTTFGSALQFGTSHNHGQLTRVSKLPVQNEGWTRSRDHGLDRTRQRTEVEKFSKGCLGTDMLELALGDVEPKSNNVSPINQNINLNVTNRPVISVKVFPDPRADPEAYMDADSQIQAVFARNMELLNLNIRCERKGNALSNIVDLPRTTISSEVTVSPSTCQVGVRKPDSVKKYLQHNRNWPNPTHSPASLREIPFSSNEDPTIINPPILPRKPYATKHPIAGLDPESRAKD